MKPLLALAALSLLSMAACVSKQTEDDTTAQPEQTPQTDSEWSETITKHLDQELSPEVEKTQDSSSLKALLCRKASLSDKIFSLRSFDGRLCDDTYVKGLKLLGGAALLICWDDDLEDFRDSGCADKALDAYGTSKASFDKAKVNAQMEAIASDYVKKAESASGASGLPYYATTRTLFCKLPTQILGPASSVHAIWCAP